MQWTVKISPRFLEFSSLTTMTFLYVFKQRKQNALNELLLSLSESFGGDKQTELRKLHATRFIRQTRLKLNRERRVFS